MTRTRTSQKRPRGPDARSSAVRRPPPAGPTPGPPATGRRLWLALGGLLLAAFAAKLVVLWQLKDNILVQPSTVIDSAAYMKLAEQVVAGHVGLGPGLYYVSPLYIYFLAVGLAVTHSLTGIRVAQLVLGTASVGLIFATTDEWYGRRAAWCAAGLAGLTGLFTFYESVFLQASLDPFLTALALLLLARGLARERASWLVLAGVVLGIDALNRPNTVIAAAALCVLLLALRRWRLGLVLAAGVLVGLAPVGVRNVVVSHQWSLVSSQGGLNFLIGNGPDADGLFHAIPGVRPTIDGQAEDTRRVAEAALGRPLTDAEVSSYFTGLAFQWIGSHPLQWVALFARKLFYVFNAQHVALPLSYPFYAYDLHTALRFLFVGPWLLLPLGLAGLVLAAPRERRWAYVVWVAFVPAYAVSVAVFFVSERYRLPLLVPLAVGAGAAMDRLLTWGRSGQRRALGVAALLVATLAAATNWPLGFVDGDGRGEERVRMAENMATLGRVDEAQHWLALALTIYPYPERAHYRVDVQLARYYARTGDRDAAVRALRALAPPDDTPASDWLGLGRLAIELKAPDAAEPLLRRAVALAPDSADAHEQLGWALLLGQRCPDAMPEFTRATQLNPRDADAFACLGYCDLTLGHADQARHQIGAALTLDPKNGLALDLKRQLSPGRVK